MMTSLLLLAALAATASSGPVRISSETLQSPYDLVRGTVALPTDAPKAAWFPESLEYELKWGIFAVGFSDLKAQRVEDLNGRPAYRIVSEAKSNPFCDKFYKVRDLNESWIDVQDFKSLGYSKKLREGHFFRDEWVLYDYDAKSFLTKMTNKEGQSSWSSGKIPGPVQDILSAIYSLRPRALKVGDEVIVDVNTKQNWPLVIKVLRKKRIETPAGKFDTLEVEPFLRDEGLFIQKGKRLQVWLTDDVRHIPVRMSVEVFFGNITATLIKAR